MSNGSNGSNDDYSKPKFPRKSKRAAQLTGAADVLQGLLQNSKSELSDGFLRWRLEQEWMSIVGGAIGEQTAPAAFEKGVLHIWVRHSTWMQQLWYFQADIKAKVNDHVGRAWVKQVKFTLSRRAATIIPGNPQD
jgi:predicted nucleic acid-binding Zn ribbon protein